MPSFMVNGRSGCSDEEKQCRHLLLPRQSGTQSQNIYTQAVKSTSSFWLFLSLSTFYCSWPPTVLLALSTFGTYILVTTLLPAPRSATRSCDLSGLAQPTRHKTLPTLLLYNERGLLIYDEITTDATEYYLFPAEEEILKNKVDEIVRVMMHRGPTDSGLIDEVAVELGAG